LERTEPGPKATGTHSEMEGARTCSYLSSPWGRGRAQSAKCQVSPGVWEQLCLFPAGVPEPCSSICLLQPVNPSWTWALLTLSLHQGLCLGRTASNPEMKCVACCFFISKYKKKPDRRGSASQRSFKIFNASNNALGKIKCLGVWFACL
jgi:hypothetical protein